ncbi:LON peptidase substrate-binding domain-containing protein [Ectothiorhodospira lacustris]|uniref:LON peptidase substrate-binding domain-containing protein n=1 Tax=Ectothiorhodospira lacustris TaxID=2899127 RepID=UPI001EE84F46|nr:LON peptidase substrate-binding domain-containing protein [Ectothiorhodospira lacustris]MCG5500840.1 LON peptidase substrate-binding domain-containing protein [Ectothiorhodospira lacustris]MCG5510621.1 LON peptidase substrate-binding domain-containing protein [Ectothiorhodospira lacustris]MCG5521313.1 LON peptidase substrate-binding domain-containing protein [Ectothiorhodospira lacustris]
MELPLFPLNTVLFPGGVLPLRIFETRYIDMVCHCLRTDAPFGVILIREGGEVAGPAEVHTVGTWGRIIDWDQRPDGLLGITVQGEARFQVGRTWVRKDGLMMGEVTERPMPADVLLPAEFLPLSELLQRLLQELPPPYRDMTGEFDRCGWVGARLTELMPVNLAQKQAMLEMDDHLARLFHLRDALVGLHSG